MENKKLSSCEKLIVRPKHCALTKFLRHHDLRLAYDLEKIIKDCNVSPFLGCLPPELRALVDKENLSDITFKFFDILDFIVVDKYAELLNYVKYKYDMLEITALFNTKCILETGEQIHFAPDSKYREWAQNNGFLKWQNYNDDLMVCRSWLGGYGNIYKLSFPEIGVSYALKIFKTNICPNVGQGPIYEIPTALRACRAEPKYNNTIYMANLLGGQYMLSKWVNVTVDNQWLPNTRKHMIYTTADEENLPKNYCEGKRLDYGKTRKTLYGGASYPVRKLYRQMQNMTSEQIKKLESKQKNNFEKANFQQAQDIIYFEYFNQMHR